MKLLQWSLMWKPRMLLPSIPWRSSLCQGQISKFSEFGHGMCQKLRIIARGSRSRMIRGTRAK